MIRGQNWTFLIPVLNGLWYKAAKTEPTNNNNFFPNVFFSHIIFCEKVIHVEVDRNWLPSAWRTGLGSLTIDYTMEKYIKKKLSLEWMKTNLKIERKNLKPYAIIQNQTDIYQKVNCS